MTPDDGRMGNKKKGELGTFAGVFTPSILTILGIILFLRLGFVVGAGGLGRALLVLALANVISLVTSSSIAAIATNLKVKGGGDYYVISRTLGVEYGGALGIVLFAAQSISIAFYAIGFGEALATVIGSDWVFMPRAIALSAVAGLFALAWLGADVATKFQYVVMAVLGAALVAFFAGGLGRFSGETLRANWSGSSDISFWVLFAIFFPAVTGFTQGVSMSGDLKDPGRSIPRGTFCAVGFSIVVYFGAAFVFAGAMPGGALIRDYEAMRNVSSWAPLIDAGVIAATLSSALASFLGAPRILQSLAADNVFPFLRPFAAGHGPSSNPRRGVLLSLAIAVITIAAGDLNVIAPVVSMFFLISYGLLNYAVFFEARAKSPSFRPSFRWFDARVAFLGSLACLGAMLAIHAVAGAIAIAAVMAIHQYLSRTVEVTRWSDSVRSYRLQKLRTTLFGVAEDPPHMRDWRPVILVFSENRARRARALAFASWIEGGSGFTSVIKVIDRPAARAETVRKELATLQAEIKESGCEAFARVVRVADLETGIPVLLESFGIGPLKANVMLLDWFDNGSAPDEEGLRRFGRYLKMARVAHCNTVFYEGASEDEVRLAALEPKARRIDIWYGDDATGRLMLLLAYLMTRNDAFEEATIRVLAARPEGVSEAKWRARLDEMLQDVRIDATVEIPATADDAAVRAASVDAAVVFLPLRVMRGSPTCNLTNDLTTLVKDLPHTALVMASEDIELDAEPETGHKS